MFPSEIVCSPHFNKSVHHLTHKLRNFLKIGRGRILDAPCTKTTQNTSLTQIKYLPAGATRRLAQKNCCALHFGKHSSFVIYLIILSAFKSLKLSFSVPEIREMHLAPAGDTFDIFNVLKQDDHPDYHKADRTHDIL